MSDIPSFPYNILWEERMVRSVANLTRKDGEDLLAIAPPVPVKTEVELFPVSRRERSPESFAGRKNSGSRSINDFRLTIDD